MAIKISELTELSGDELLERLAETKEELFNLRFQNATGQLDNYKRLGELRKDVARIRTVLRQHELTGESEELSPPTEAKIEVAEERESQFRPRRSRGAGTAPGGAES